MDKHCLPLLFAGLFAFSNGTQGRVVADDVCPKHAVDVASYATCEGDQVVSAGALDLRGAVLPAEGISPLKLTSAGLYVDAANAYRLKVGNPQRVFLVDVRSQLEVVLTGRPTVVDIHVPYVEHTLYLNEGRRGWTVAENDQFIDDLTQRLQQRDADFDAVIMVMCQSGERSAKVADRLAELGYLLVFNVIDGFEGDLDAGGKRQLNGWKNAGLPWAQDGHATTNFIELSATN